MAARKPSELLQSSINLGSANPKEAFRDIRNYLAGQFLGSTRDNALLDEVMKCLFYKLYVELGHNKASHSKDVFARAKHAREVFSEVRKDHPDIFPVGTEILLSPEGICFVLDACSFSLVDSESDPVGDAFEVFVGSESRGNNGQFFTPRSATDLLTELIDPKPHETVIDPACGAGGFLASVIRHHLAQGYNRHALGELAAHNLYGIDKDDYLARLAKAHVSLLSGGEPIIKCADSISLRDDNGSIENHLPDGGFDVLLTNPPFGAKIVSATAAVLRSFNLARKWRLDETTGRWQATSELKTQVPPQVLFVERCLALVKDGGRLGMVLPESLISNKSHRFVVQYLMDHAHVTAVVGMPEALFKTSGKGGTHTKTCLVVAQKDARRERGATSVFMAEAKWCGHDSRAKKIPHNDLPIIAANIDQVRRTGKIEPSPLGFLINEDDIKRHILCPHYYDPKIDQELEDLSATHRLFKFSDLVNEAVLSVSTGDELGKLAYGTGDIPFIRTSDMSNWEVKVDAKHGVDIEIYKKFKKKQDVQPHDIFMVRDGTYLIGTCAIVSPGEEKLVYQSHIYKIRVCENKHGITPFNLLAVFSSALVQRQIKAKQFTMDIIDSLGDRIYELVLPIPLDSGQRDEVDRLVKSAIESRASARDCALQARNLATRTIKPPLKGAREKAA